MLCIIGLEENQLFIKIWEGNTYLRVILYMFEYANQYRYVATPISNI